MICISPTFLKALSRRWIHLRRSSWLAVIHRYVVLQLSHQWRMRRLVAKGKKLTVVPPELRYSKRKWRVKKNRINNPVQNGQNKNKQTKTKNAKGRVNSFCSLFQSLQLVLLPWKVHSCIDRHPTSAGSHQTSPALYSPSPVHHPASSFVSNRLPIAHPSVYKSSPSPTPLNLVKWPEIAWINARQI